MDFTLKSMKAALAEAWRKHTYWGRISSLATELGACRYLLEIERSARKACWKADWEEKREAERKIRALQEEVVALSEGHETIREELQAKTAYVSTLVTCTSDLADRIDQLQDEIRAKDETIKALQNAPFLRRAIKRFYKRTLR